MKKISIVAVLAIAAAGFTACGNQGPKANLKTDVDTMSYAIGMAQTQGLKEYLVGSLDVDTAYMAEFIKGLNEGANAGDNKKKAAYYAGIQIGQQIANRMVKGINHEVFGDDSTKTISPKERPRWIHQRYYWQEGSDDSRLCSGGCSAPDPEHQG